MAGSFEGRVALITGASSGIGRALALDLAARGCRVGLVARRVAALEDLAGQIRAAGGVAGWEGGDVGDRDDVHRAAAGLADRLGPADLVVANAGIGLPTTLEPMNIEVIERTFRVNVLGAIYTVEATLPAMLAAGRGQVVAISSLAGFQAMPGESAYCASKAALTTYMDGLRIQLRPRGVAVTTVCPGFVRTPMTEADPYIKLFEMDAAAAARRIVRAIERRVKVVRFPWPTDALVRMVRFAPDWLKARIFADTAKHAGEVESLARSRLGGD